MARPLPQSLDGMYLDQLVELSKERMPTSAEINACCAAGVGSEEELVDALALNVARSYAAGKLGFVECDRIMNSLNVWSMNTRDRLLSDLADQIYLAFDAGEYHHRGDDNTVDPEVKYTKPMIEKVLKETNAV